MLKYITLWQNVQLDKWKKHCGCQCDCEIMEIVMNNLTKTEFMKIYNEGRKSYR